MCLFKWYAKGPFERGEGLEGAITIIIIILIIKCQISNNHDHNHQHVIIMITRVSAAFVEVEKN